MPFREAAPPIGVSLAWIEPLAMGAPKMLNLISNERMPVALQFF